MARPTGVWSDKEFRNALRMAVSEKDDKGFRKLRQLANKLVDAGLSGDVQAIKEVADRLDGKSTQIIEQTITERMVVNAPAPEKDADEWASKHQPKVH